MTAVDGVEDSFGRAITAEYRDRIFVAVIFNLVFDKEESGPKVMDRFLRLLSDVDKIAFVWVGGWI